MMPKKPSVFFFKNLGGGLDVSLCGENQCFLPVMAAIKMLENRNQAIMLNVFLSIPFYVNAFACHDLH
jgi:hypothetical protein